MADVPLFVTFSLIDHSAKDSSPCGAVLLTWDEAANGDGPIGLVALSPDATGSGYHNAIHYTHSSTLRTLEEIFGVSPLLRDAQNATDLSDLFRSFP